jgi:hypothetical protein
LIIRNKRTLMAPDRSNVTPPKNVAADGTLWPLNDDHRVTVVGRTTMEYAIG